MYFGTAENYIYVKNIQYIKNGEFMSNNPNALIKIKNNKVHLNVIEVEENTDEYIFTAEFMYGIFKKYSQYTFEPPEIILKLKTPNNDLYMFIIEFKTLEDLMNFNYIIINDVYYED